jgi:hypothetical protein
MGIVVNGVELTDQTLSDLKGLFNVVQKNDPSSATPNAQYLHGQFPGNPNQYGLFSDPGVRPERFSARPNPRSLAKLLRPMKSDYINEKLEIVTGQTAGSTTNASGWCADGALPGVLKTCQQIYTYGKYKARTSLAPIQTIGQLRTRADIPGQILNTPPLENPLMPEMMYRLTDDRSQEQLAWYTLGNQFQISFENEIWKGVAGTDTSIPGWWTDMASLDSQIKTGYADAVSLLPCPAADSQVVSWNADIAATVSGRNIMQAMTDMFYAAQDTADIVGMSGTRFFWAMRKEQFRALTEVWSCQYATYRCQTGTAGQPFVNQVVDTNRLRLEMVQGQYLLIDGMPVPVVFSDGITIQQLAGGAQRVLRSDIYLLPVEWNGRPLLNMEFFNMGNQYAREYAALVYNDALFLNNGMYVATKNSRNGCIEFEINAMFRIVLETPFLAGRIDDVSFTYQAQTRTADPAVSFLYVDGGTSYRT